MSEATKNISVKPCSLFTDFDIDLFKAGKHYRLYEKLGSKIIDHDGQKGVYFAVWAPNANKVSVSGSFNFWSKESHTLFQRWDGSGIWEGFIPDLEQGTLYKYTIQSNTGQQVEKADPFALSAEIPPKTASVIWDLDYQWKDQTWMDKRSDHNKHDAPFSVYEVHLGSWRKKNDATESLSYRELANDLVSYVKEMGFTHVEFMPVMEHPYFPSWGYQITGYFAPSSRFGTPEEFMFLVDALHKENIGVILDWVPSHFPNDAHGLAQFDGTHLFEHADPRKGFHPDWKSAIFNYDRHEVRSFLISNALFWLDKYHIDGLRVDAVASMLYLDYSRKEGEWIPNEYGGNENLGAIEFLKEFNTTVYANYPDTVTIAEESTAFNGVSRPVHSNGLGFGQKWMMGWMHDSLNFMQKESIHRKFHLNEITFSLIYAFTENFMLPLSHDEVVHGKGSLMDRMPGDEWQKFANLRLLYTYMFTHPGTNLLFMGSEFAQTSEWSIERGLEWWLLQFPLHKGIQKLIQDLNTLLKGHSQLYDLQFDPAGFEWLIQEDWDNSVMAYFRYDKTKKDPLLIVCNFTPVPREVYNLGVPQDGQWIEILNSDHESYGGSNYINENPLSTSKGEWQGHQHFISPKLGPLAVQVFKKK